jgi:hypothetical protein
MKQSAEGSANILKYYKKEGKNPLQEVALERAIKNKISIEEQTRKTVDSLTRDCSPRVPERKSGLVRLRAAFFAVCCGCRCFPRLHDNPRQEKPTGGIYISFCMESYGSLSRLVA